MHRNSITILLGMSSFLGSAVAPTSSVAQDDEPHQFDTQSFCTYGDVKLSLIGFDFDHNGWLYCDARRMAVGDGKLLSALGGENSPFGGDGQSTFSLPDLRKAEAALTATDFSKTISLPFEVVADPEQGNRLKVTEYTGDDDLLRPGDMVFDVGRPDSFNESVDVDTEAALKSAIFRMKKQDGLVALWTKRGDADADWVFINVDTLPASVPRQPEGELRGVVCYSLFSGTQTPAPGAILADIKLTAITYDQRGFQRCNGYQMPLNRDTMPLFSLTPKQLHKDGRSTFILPDMREAEKKLRVAAGIHAGSNALRYVTRPYADHYPDRVGHPFELDGNVPDWFIGDIRLTTSSSEDDSDVFLPCDGRTLSIAEYQVLYSLIGTNFGGKGRTTFKLPDLRKAEVELRKSAGIPNDSTTLRYRIAVKNVRFPSRR